MSVLPPEIKIEVALRLAPEKAIMEFMGPVRVKPVEEVQQTFVAILRRQEESGEIIINPGGEDTMLWGSPTHLCMP